MSFMTAKERLYLTADRKALVREGDPAAASLYVAPGDEIPGSAVELFGLVDGTIADKKGSKGSGNKGDTKEQGPGQDKEQKPGKDKGAGSGTKGVGATPGTSDTPAGDELTKVKFVGPAVAAGLAKAGITTIAAIAAIDPANPPAVGGTGARTNWADIVESAKALVAAASADQKQGGGDASGDAGADAGAADQQAN